MIGLVLFSYLAFSKLVSILLKSLFVLVDRYQTTRIPDYFRGENIQKPIVIARNRIFISTHLRSCPCNTLLHHLKQKELHNISIHQIIYYMLISLIAIHTWSASPRVSSTPSCGYATCSFIHSYNTIKTKKHGSAIYVACFEIWKR